MEDKINDIIIEHLGLSIFIFCALIVGIVCLSVWCYKVYLKVNRIDDFPCNRHQEKMNEHDNAVARIETAITYLTKEIDTAMRAYQQQNIKTDGFTQTRSPLSITEQGWDMVKRLGMEDMFNNNWKRINDLINENVKSTNAYDIDRFCVEQAVVFPDKFLSENEISILKEDAYKNGLLLTSYMKVVAVLSRDRYLKEHNISMEENR